MKNSRRVMAAKMILYPAVGILQLALEFANPKMPQLFDIVGVVLIAMGVGYAVKLLGDEK